MQVYVASPVHYSEDLRAEIKKSLEKWGYEPKLSEFSESFHVERGVDSYVACIHAIKASDLFISIITPRYGGLVEKSTIQQLGPHYLEFIEKDWIKENYNKKSRISITELEYISAIINQRPIINFCHEDVWNTLQIWKINKDMEFPHFFQNGPKVLQFLDRIRKIEEGKRDNWIHKFSTSVDFKSKLKVQLGVNEILVQQIKNYRSSLLNNLQKCEKLYVPLRISDSHCQSDSNQNRLLSIPKKTEENAFDLMKMIKENKFALLLGDPGQGKSTALQHIAYQFVSSDEKIIPILIKLRSYNGGKINDRLIISLSEHNFFISKKKLDKYLKNGNFIILFDGLNEISNKYHDEAIGALNDFFNLYKNNTMVFTSRERDYKSELEKIQPKIFFICPFIEDQIINFLEKYSDLPYHTAHKLYESFEE